MTKEEFEKQLDSSIKKIDSSITPEYFIKQLELYSNSEERKELSQLSFGYGVFRESIRKSIEFTSDVLRELFEFEDEKGH